MDGGSVGNLRYAYRDGTGWHFEMVDVEPEVGSYSSLALDAEGHPHISYFNHGDHDLKYAYKDAVGWHVETVESDGWVGSSPSLELDVDGYAHIDPPPLVVPPSM